MSTHYDVIIIGIGPGRGALAYKLARFSLPGMAPVLVPLRPSSEHILIVRAPGARDQHGCHSTPLIVRPQRARRVVWLLPSLICEGLETVCETWRTRASFTRGPGAP